MSVKRKPSETSLDQQQEVENRDIVNDNGEKRVRSESTISHSSWIYRLTAPTPTPSTKSKETTTEEEEQPKVNIELKQEEAQVAPAPAIENTTDDTIEEKAESLAGKMEQNNSSGIWSWLGYNNSGPQQSDIYGPKKEADSENSATTAEKEGEKEQQIVTDALKEDTNKNETQVEKHHYATASSSAPAPRPSYWKSLFASTSTSTVNSTEENNKDSVIISDDNNDEQQQPPQPNTSTIEPSAEGQAATETTNTTNEDTSAPASRKAPIPPSKNNIVLPTFKSQFQPSLIPTTATQDDSNIFYKAIHAINSIFTQKSASSSNKPINAEDWQDIHRLSTMIDSMKSDPGHVNGKKIVIIGVHGWFPMKLVRSVVGEPTGTSTKFCEQMTAAVKIYFHQEHNLEIPDEAITSIPLQWEGKVLERVAKLYDFINADYKETITSADVILWTTHSQGTPVSAILLRKLIEEKIMDVERQPVCMLAMAGISHGPFPSLKGSLLVKYFEADAARELFEFMDSNSDISVQYREAMAYILQNKCKAVLVGSMQDQVVPLYSAIMSGITHPNILRAIYIDGHIYTKDDFLIRLITFALRLLNVGLSDHGFLIHISEVLAGNIYSWEGGHSTVYEELDVFMLPLQYLFETYPFGNMEVQKPFAFIQQEFKNASDRAKQNVLDKVKARLDPFQAKARLNPFHLPWAMRGIWDDPRILGDDLLSRELDTLQDLFDKWNPTSARLKEIKFRLEPLKARL